MNARFRRTRVEIHIWRENVEFVNLSDLDLRDSVSEMDRCDQSGIQDFSGTSKQQELQQEDDYNQFRMESAYHPTQPESEQASPHTGDLAVDPDYARWLSHQLALPLPSEHGYRLNSMQAPPSQIPSESIPATNPAFIDSGEHNFHIPRYSDNDFAKRANEDINRRLGRTPGGTSIVEPDSVLEESGRLYHGYREGKYLIPNDAVSICFLTPTCPTTKTTIIGRTRSPRFAASGLYVTA